MYPKSFGVGGDLRRASVPDFGECTTTSPQPSSELLAPPKITHAYIHACMHIDTQTYNHTYTDIDK